MAKKNTISTRSYVRLKCLTTIDVCKWKRLSSLWVVSWDWRNDESSSMIDCKVRYYCTSPSLRYLADVWLYICCYGTEQYSVRYNTQPFSGTYSKIILLGKITERACWKGSALLIIHNFVRVTFSPLFLFLILLQKPADRNIVQAVSCRPHTN
jgi:hypothetical protein